LRGLRLAQRRSSKSVCCVADAMTCHVDARIAASFDPDKGVRSGKPRTP
jgi:hypothetical protein